jgi:uncharacterized protein (TIGR02231 family)
VIAVLLVLQAMTVTAPVDSVVVYPQQVLVVRTASVNVNGSGELSFPGLPGGLVDNTVRVRAPGLRIGEVQVKAGYLAEPTPEVRRLELRLQQLEDAQQGFDNEVAVLAAKEQFLNSIKLGTPELIAKDLAQGKVAVESWRGALGFMADELARVKARGVALARERTEQQRLVEAARLEYQAALAAVENRKEVSFDYAAAAGSYQVELSYVVPHAASWSPYYELRADPAGGRVELYYYAKLEQRTGEDWSRVRVVLSTTTPVTGISAPAATPWYVSLYEVVTRRRVGKAAAESRPAPTPGYGMLDAELGEAGDAMPVETGISLQYVIPGRVSLASGEAAKKLGLANANLGAEFEYYALPRLREQAFLTGRVENSSGFVLLPGQANTYVGGEYTGSTWLGTVAPQETTLLSFGTDERVKVKWELVKSFKSKAGMFGKSERMSYVYRTTVENFNSKPVSIKLIEQVPVSQQGEIKVNVSKVEPKPLEESKEAGSYTWQPTVEPRGRFTVNLEFSVDYPAGRSVSGLY